MATMLIPDCDLPSEIPGLAPLRFDLQRVGLEIALVKIFSETCRVISRFDAVSVRPKISQSDWTKEIGRCVPKNIEKRFYNQRDTKFVVR